MFEVSAIGCRYLRAIPLYVVFVFHRAKVVRFMLLFCADSRTEEHGCWLIDCNLLFLHTGFL